VGSFDQTVPHPRLPQQALLERSHPSPIAIMIVTEKVEEAMQREDPKLDRKAMAEVARLAAGHSGGDDNIAEVTLG
jgi:hypothetical protein